MVLLASPYSVTTDFGGGPVDTTALRREIIADVTLTQTPNYIIIDGDVVDIDFPIALSGGEVIALDAVVAAHPALPGLDGDGRQVFVFATPPTVNDDADDEVSLGDLWVDTAANKIYACSDVTVGAAVWTVLAPEAGAVTTAPTDPTVTDDTNAGYSVGDLWVNTATGEAFIATDVTAGAAVWGLITPPDTLTGFIFEAESASVVTHNSTTFLEKLTASTGAIEAGDYILFWSYNWNADTTTTSFVAQLEQDDTTVLMDHVQEPKDNTGDFANTGSDQQHNASGFIPLTLGAGTYQFDIDFRTETATTEVSMWNARLFMIRVA